MHTGTGPERHLPCERCHAVKAYQGLERFILDVVIIVILSTLVVALKQAFVHRHKPMA